MCNVSKFILQMIEQLTADKAQLQEEKDSIDMQFKVHQKQLEMIKHDFEELQEKSYQVTVYLLCALIISMWRFRCAYCSGIKVINQIL